MKTVPPAVGALIVAVLLGGCAWDGPMSTVVARSDLARSILSVYGIITWASAIIGVLVFVVLGWILLRFRDRPGGPLPRQIHGHALLEIAWTIAPALVLLIIAIPTIQVIFRTQGVAAPPSALTRMRPSGRPRIWKLGVMARPPLRLLRKGNQS